MDAAVAVVLVVIILAGSSYFFYRTNEDFVTNLQMLRIGSDITAVLDAEGSLDTFDPLQIRTSIESILPVNYNMRLVIYSTYYSQPLIVEAGSLTSGKQFVVSGKRYFYPQSSGRGYPSLAIYEVWAR